MWDVSLRSHCSSSGRVPPTRLRSFRRQRGRGGRSVPTVGRATLAIEWPPALFSLSMSPATLLARLKGRRWGPWGRAPGTFPARQRTMRDVIAWSNYLLTEKTKPYLGGWPCSPDVARSARSLGRPASSPLVAKADRRSVPSRRPSRTGSTGLSALVESGLLEVVETESPTVTALLAGEVDGAPGQPVGSEGGFSFSATPFRGGGGSRRGDLLPSAGNGPGLSSTAE